MLSADMSRGLAALSTFSFGGGAIAREACWRGHAEGVPSISELPLNTAECVRCQSGRGGSLEPLSSPTWHDAPAHGS